jgi:Amt family ammonium transporter
MVAGLGTITPASGFVGPGGAVVIGAAAGLLCFLATQFLKRELHVDDTLDVSPVHGVGGVIGTILTGVFVSATLGGVGYASGMDMARQVSVQALGVAATALWCGGMTWLLLKFIDAAVGLRVTEEQESEGLDLALHGERGYIE